MVNTAAYNYSSTPIMNSVVRQSPSFPMEGSTDFTDDNSSSVRGRSRSFSQTKPPVLNTEQVTGKRRKSLCVIGTSKSEPTNVLNASGKKIHMYIQMLLFVPSRHNG